VTEAREDTGPRAAVVRGEELPMPLDWDNTLVGTPAVEYRRDRLHEQTEVHDQALLKEVLLIELDLLLEGQLRAAADLPDAGKSRQGVETDAVTHGVAGDLAGHRGTGTYEGHLALQDAPELRELIEAEAADDTTHRGDAGIVLHLECHAVAVLVLGEELHLESFRIHDHGAKLGEAKRLAVDADPVLPEEDGTEVSQLDRNGNQKKQRQKQAKCCEGYSYVECPLGGEDQLPLDLGK